MALRRIIERIPIQVIGSSNDGYARLASSTTLNWSSI